MDTQSKAKKKKTSLNGESGESSVRTTYGQNEHERGISVSARLRTTHSWGFVQTLLALASCFCRRPESHDRLERMNSVFLLRFLQEGGEIVLELSLPSVFLISAFSSFAGCPVFGRFHNFFIVFMRSSIPRARCVLLPSYLLFFVPA